MVRTVRSLRGAPVVTGLPGFHRVLVVAPHPDDETLGCGGTTARLTDRGATVTLLMVTDGGATQGAPVSTAEVARIRRAEATRAAEVIGADPRFLALPDGEVRSVIDELTIALKDAIEELRPEVVFAPWLLDGHSDHRAVADALAAAIEKLEGGVAPEIWGYETWTALIPNRIVEITSVIERKREALAAHEMASLALDISAGEGIARWRTMQSLGGRGWAEAFMAISPEDYVALAAELTDIP